MTNHLHLLLMPKKAEAVPKLMISLGRRYVQYINRGYQIKEIKRARVEFPEKC